MGLADFALGQAKAYAKQKLSGGAGGALLDLGERLLGQRGMKPVPSSVSVNQGRYHWFDKARGRPDPLLDIYWWVQLPDLPASLMEGGGVSSLSWEYVEEATLPFIEFEQVSNYRAGKNYHYPSHHNINTLQLKLYGDVKAQAFNYFSAWQLLMLNTATGLYFAPADYKKRIQVHILDAAQLTVAMFSYEGCWPTNVDQMNLVSGQTGRITPTVTFSVDSMSAQFGKFSPDQVPNLVSSISKDFPASISKLPSIFPNVFSTLPGLLFR